MKKFLISIACLLAAFAASADEGMWLLPMLQKFNEDAMRNIGCRLTAEDIYNIIPQDGYGLWYHSQHLSTHR